MNDIFTFTKQQKKGFGLCWTGNDGWLMSSGGHLIATDLDLFHEDRIVPSSISPELLSENLEFLFITHEHGDHFNFETCKILKDKSRCTFILPKSCSQTANDLKLPEERIIWVSPRQNISPADWLQVKTIRAIHGHMKHSVYINANLDDCGYVISFGGQNIMQPGDTVLLQDHLLLTDIDILFVSPTEHNTYLEGSFNLIDTLRPKHVYAQHFDTYKIDKTNWFWTIGYPNELKELLPYGLKERFSRPMLDQFFILSDSMVCADID